MKTRLLLAANVHTKSVPTKFKESEVFKFFVEEVWVNFTTPELAQRCLNYDIRSIETEAKLFAVRLALPALLVEHKDMTDMHHRLRERGAAVLNNQLTAKAQEKFFEEWKVVDPWRKADASRARASMRAEDEAGDLLRSDVEKEKEKSFYVVPRIYEVDIGVQICDVLHPSVVFPSKEYSMVFIDPPQGLLDPKTHPWDAVGWGSDQVIYSNRNNCY